MIGNAARQAKAEVIEKSKPVLGNIGIRQGGQQCSRFAIVSRDAVALHVQIGKLNTGVVDETHGPLKECCSERGVLIDVISVFEQHPVLIGTGCVTALSQKDFIVIAARIIPGYEFVVYSRE